MGFRTVQGDGRIKGLSPQVFVIRSDSKRHTLFHFSTLVFPSYFPQSLFQFIDSKRLKNLNSE